MYKVIIYFLLVIFLDGQLYAGCPLPVQHIKKDIKANCTGYLFSPEKELQVRTANEKYKLLDEKSKLYIQIIDTYKQRSEITEQIIQKEQEKAELWRVRAEDITLKYTQQQDRRGWRDWIFFGMGVAVTAIAGWSMGQASK